MKRFLTALAALVAVAWPPGMAFAQSTAAPVVTGYLTTSGCPYGQTSCFIQFGATGPSGGTVTANQGAAGVTPWPTTDSNGGASGTGITQPTGGSGFLGWLSGIYKAVTGTGTTSQDVQGSSASGAADAGNPVKTGCVFNTTPPTVTTGQRVDCQAVADGSGVMAAAGLLTTGTNLNGGVIVPYQVGGARTVSLPWAVSNYLLGSSSRDNQVEITGAATTGIGDAAVALAPHSAVAGALSNTTPAGNAPAHNASSLIACTAACNGYKVEVISLAAAGYVMVFDAITAPGDGAVTPAVCMPLAVTSGLSLTLGQADIPMRFATGLTAVFSTGANCSTKTAASADMIRVLAK